MSNKDPSDLYDLEKLEKEITAFSGKAANVIRAGFSGISRALAFTRVAAIATQKGVATVTSPETAVRLAVRGLVEVAVKLKVSEESVIDAVRAAFEKRTLGVSDQDIVVRKDKRK